MEFEDLGKHCEFCRQKDILPFRCNYCNKYFCLDHIKREEHKCPRANANDRSVIVCSKCGQLIQLLPDVKPSILIEEHVQFQCNPSLKKVIRRCPVPGCKERLTLVNTYKCDVCGREFCMKHRYKEDHCCSPPKEKSWVNNLLSFVSRSKEER